MNTATYNDEAAVECHDLHAGSLQRRLCGTIVAERYGDQTNFGNGSTLFTVGSSSGLPFYGSAVEEGAGFAWSITPLPHTTEDPVMNHLRRQRQHSQEHARERVGYLALSSKYYTSPEVQAMWAEASNYFPVRQSVADGLGDYFDANPTYKTAFDLLQYGTAEPPVPGYDFVRDEVREVMAAIATAARFKPH